MNFFYKIIVLIFFAFSYHLSAQDSDVVLKKIYRQIQEAEQKNPDSAIVIAKNFLSKIEDRTAKANICIEISQCYSLLGNREQAISYALEAKKEALQTDNYELIPRVFGSLANQYRNASLLTNAKKELQEGFNYVNKMPQDVSNNWIKSAFLREYSNILFAEEKTDSSIIYSYKALQPISLAKKGKENKKETTYNSLIYNDLVESFIIKNKLDSAEFYSLKAIKNVAGMMNEEDFKKRGNLHLSLIYYKKKEYKRALDTLKSLEKIIKEDEYPLKADLYIYFAQNYKATGDFKNYQKYNDLYLGVKDQLSEEEKKAVNKVLLHLDNENEEEIKKNLLNRKLLFGVSLLALLIIGLLIFYFQRKRKSEKGFYREYIAKLENENLNQRVTSNTGEIKESVKISDEIEQNLLLQLQKFENSEKFIDGNITLPVLASKFKTNTKYLSEIIKKHKGQNFNTYINNLRIEYICKKILEDSDYRKYKISHLATVSGFSSVDTFSKVFKNITGILPSVFIENALQNMNAEI